MYILFCLVVYYGNHFSEFFFDVFKYVQEQNNLSCGEWWKWMFMFNQVRCVRLIGFVLNYMCECVSVRAVAMQLGFLLCRSIQGFMYYFVVNIGQVVVGRLALLRMLGQ
eukprot:TRINITY_DN13755_c0_g1_i6.p4 TRINITY_DN13755_c0_g1~~TRINITY_DN13755_c0_g1_i6.p4  ORF type:complete len:109 (-),score=8.54 TRINITY_DN13755_c0_g1_i6:86-412(-)